MHALRLAGHGFVCGCRGTHQAWKPGAASGGSRKQTWWVNARLSSLQEAAGSGDPDVRDGGGLWLEKNVDSRGGDMGLWSVKSAAECVGEKESVDGAGNAGISSERLRELVSTRRYREAVGMYRGMREDGEEVSTDAFVVVLKACGGLRELDAGREVHAHMIQSGNDFQVFAINSLMDMYVKCGSMVDARHVFDNMVERSAVSWNIIVLGYANEDQVELALEMYAWMQQEQVRPTRATFVGALKACSSMAALEKGTEVDGRIVKLRSLGIGRRIHAQLVDAGFESDVFVTTTLVDMYAKCESLEDARHVFCSLPRRDVVSWTAIILAHVEEQQNELALQCYSQMQEEGVAPNQRTFVAALKACSSLACVPEKMECLEKGRAIHSEVVKAGFDSNLFVATTLVDMYANCGSLEDARHVFRALPRHDVVSWNAMISGYAEEGEGEVALQLYAQMQKEGVVPNHRTFVAALRACSSLAALEEGQDVDGKLVKALCLKKGRAIHAKLVKDGCESDVFVRNTLVDMYARCGSIVDARRVFDKLHHRNAVSWAGIVMAYAAQGENEEALKLYAQSQAHGVPATSWTFVSILKACGNAAALETGKDIHAQICKAGLEGNTIVATSLIDMYCKCGSMVDAEQVFEALPTQDLVAWSSLIAGYARQGESEHVFRLLDRMWQEGVRPDGVTYLSVLTVCSHVGLVDLGQKCFKDMRNDHGITPTIEHYTCMADLLGRAGRVDEAVEMFENMPFKANLVGWMSVLSACRKWNNVELGRRAFHCAVELDERCAVAYVLMSNIYANAHMWKERDEIHEMRKRRKVWKTPGWSWWTDDDGMMHTFTAGDTSHPHIEDISTKLKDLYSKMEEQGYVPHVDSVLWDIPDDEKEIALCGHSEKLAIAYALINTPPGQSIRIAKNLRVCNDCHSAIALISKIEGRNIVCRDASRFHNYKEGKCSCGDYW